MLQIKNPVLPGFNADPSIIRVDDTYYIANSTFEWFPGVRLHESKDLVHWNLLPSALSTTTLLDMKGNPSSGGIWALDLSYADGKFWLIYTDVKVTEGPFKDMINYLTTAEDIRGPWSDPIRVNGVGFDASLFHDDDGRKYLVQQTWDHREYHHAFDGITVTEFDTETMKLKPETARTIYAGTDVKLVEGPHLYKINGYYYLFAAQGGTVWTHQEVVARSKTLDALSFETEPGDPFITNFDTPELEIQKQGHGGKVLVDAPKDAILTEAPADHSMHDEFDTPKLHDEWNTLRVPFTEEMGTTGDGRLTLVGKGSLCNKHELSLVAKRWQAFNFDAEVKVKFDPFNYQQMAGLTNFYNDKHWSFAFVTWNEKNGRVIEVAECNRGGYRSFLRDDAIPVPDDVEFVWLRTKVRKQSYSYEYSFDGKNYTEIPGTLDAAVLSDDYVLQSYGGFFTGAFVGMACVDYSGYDQTAEFRSFDYKELD